MLPNVAQWDGVAWQPMDAGMDGAVTSFATYDGELIAGGGFTTASAHPAAHIAAWNGSSWRPLGAGTSRGVSRLAVYDGRLFASYSVPADPPTLTSQAITSWDGSSWRSEGSAIGYYLLAMESLNNRLYLGGLFWSIQGQPTNSLTALIESCGPVCGSIDFNHDGDAATDADIQAFFACLAGNCCPSCGSADFNNDGDTATDADIESFFRVLAGDNC